ncbi:type VI secretion system-associated protein TagO [Serratia liquefaciens]|uniref:Type VI secretion protein n=1 Tax=Serratia liquefaciens TaxID=614 RepID=A0A515CX10_SERLI|nr:type VI secretion system-associated protein TagO [Serratia liquefaciens]QDL32691.1 type VI secretion protein [Serratia liquefaciens]
MKKTLSFIVFSSFFGLVHAETNISDQIGQCQKLTSDTDRLACFDKVSKLKPDAKTESAESLSVGKWDSRTEKSPIDDSNNVYVFLPAENEVQVQFKGAIVPTLYATCREKKTELFIDWNTFIGVDRVRVLTRIDAQKAVNSTWLISSDNKATFHSGQTVSFIKQLMKSKKMFVQVTPYGDSPAQTTFDLSGLSNAIKPLRESCNW